MQYDLERALMEINSVQHREELLQHVSLFLKYVPPQCSDYNYSSLSRQNCKYKWLLETGGLSLIEQHNLLESHNMSSERNPPRGIMNSFSKKLHN